MIIEIARKIIYNFLKRHLLKIFLITNFIIVALHYILKLIATYNFLIRITVVDIPIL